MLDAGLRLYWEVGRRSLRRQVTYGTASPATWVVLAVSLVLAVTVSFAWRFMLNAVAFWTFDARGIGSLASVVVTLLSGW